MKVTFTTSFLYYPIHAVPECVTNQNVLNACPYIWVLPAHVWCAHPPNYFSPTPASRQPLWASLFQRPFNTFISKGVEGAAAENGVGRGTIRGLTVSSVRLKFPLCTPAWIWLECTYLGNEPITLRHIENIWWQLSWANAMLLLITPLPLVTYVFRSLDQANGSVNIL